MRTIVFFDGQNLYHGAREAWAPDPPVPKSPYGYPSYDVKKLAEALCAADPRRVLSQIRFYTGVNPLSRVRSGMVFGQTNFGSLVAKEFMFIAEESILADKKKALT